MANDSVLPIDPWTLRCFWGHEKCQQRNDLREFTVEIRYKKLSKKRLGERNCFVIARKNGEDIFHAHQFVNDATKKPTTPLDPKMVLFKGRAYGKDDATENPYEGRRIRGWLYARWRKSTCPLLERRWFWTLTTFCFPRTKHSLESVRKLFHRSVWIISAHVFYRV